MAELGAATPSSHPFYDPLMLLGVAEGNGEGEGGGMRKHTKNTPAAPMGLRPKLVGVGLESTPDDEKGERLERPSDLR